MGKYIRRERKPYNVSYGKEFKMLVVAATKEYTPFSLSRKLGIPVSNIYCWCKSPKYQNSELPILTPEELKQILQDNNTDIEINMDDIEFLKGHIKEQEFKISKQREQISKLKGVIKSYQRLFDDIT